MHAFVLFCFEIQTPVVKISFYYYQRGSENLQLITLLKICQIGEIKLNPDILLTIRSKIQQSKPLKIKPFSVVSCLPPELPQKAKNLYSLSSTVT